MGKINVIYCRTQFWFNLISGGSVGHTLGILNGFKNNDCNVYILSNELPYGAENFSYSIYNPIIKRPQWFGELIYNIYAAKFFKNKIIKFNPGFIYHRFSGFTYFIALLSKKTRTPLVLEFNSFDSWKLKHWGKSSNTVKRFFQKYVIYKIVKKIENFNLRNAAIIVTVSEVLKSDLISMGISEEKIIFSPNGVDINKFNPSLSNSPGVIALRKKLNISGEKTIIGFSGTFGRWHGILQLTEAIDFILSNMLDENLHFLIIGSGGDLKDHMYNRLVKFANITFTGTVPYSEIQNYLALCDVLLSPHCPQADGNEFFGSPTKLFEYMAMGKAIIASRLGQIGSILEDDLDAILVEPGNVKNLIEAILNLSKDRNQMRRLGINARKKVEREYTWDNSVKIIMEKIYKSNFFKNG